MFELNKIGKDTYYIESPAKIGLYARNPQEVILIDSGNDKDAGRKVRQILDRSNWGLKAIYNTHSNADHIGGNMYLQGQTGCKIYAPGVECDFTRHPQLEPAFLYGGFAPKDLRHKFLMAASSDSEYLTTANLPQGFEIIPLPGHFFDMVGYRTPDNVVFLADCLSSAETLQKYQISFIYDVGAYLKTLDMTKTLAADLFVPSHSEVTTDIRPLAQLNIDKVLEISDLILQICKEPTSTEVVLQKVFTHYNLAMNFEQHVLVGSTIRSYLAWQKDTNQVTATFENNMLLWQKS